MMENISEAVPAKRHPEFSDYLITSDGRVFSEKLGQLREIFSHPNPKGYLTIRLTHASRRFSRTIHRLVLETFIGPRPFSKAVCRHLNNIKSDNRLENLRWGTAKENSADFWALDDAKEFTTKRTEKLRAAIKAGLVRRRKGVNNHNSKLTPEQVISLRADRERGVTYEDLAQKYKITASSAHKIASRQTWAHL